MSLFVAPERETIKALIAVSCKTSPEWMHMPVEKQASIVRKIERSCYNDTIISCERDGLDRHFGAGASPFVTRYQATCYRVLSNLIVSATDTQTHNTELGGPCELGTFNTSDARSTQSLVAKICLGEIDPEKISTMTSYELCPCASEAERAEISVRREQHIEKKVSRRYTCSKCKKDETTLLEYAPRAADESTKQSIQCVNCGHTWNH